MALSVALFYQAMLIAPLNGDNQNTFDSFAAGYEAYVSLRREWRPRILSNYAAGQFIKFGQYVVERRPGTFSRTSLEVGIGLWTAFWFSLSSLAFIAVKREGALLYLFGTYAALSLGYMPGITSRIYPWDMPALFFFSAFVILVGCCEIVTTRTIHPKQGGEMGGSLSPSLFDRERQLRSRAEQLRKIYWIVPLVLLAVGFKETVIVLCIAFCFFEHLPLKRGIALCAGTALLCLAIKAAIDLITDNPRLFLTMTTVSPANEIRVLHNIRILARVHIEHPFIINAGTFVGFLLLPIRSRRMLMLKVVCVLFTIGNFAFGMIEEYRIWFEMIPIALYGFELAFFREQESRAAF
jgi:hypothetical protein